MFRCASLLPKNQVLITIILLNGFGWTLPFRSCQCVVIVDNIWQRSSLCLDLATGEFISSVPAMTCNPHVHYSLADYSKLLMRKFVVTNEAVSLALSLFHSLSISLSHSLSYLCGKSYFREEWKIVHVTNKKLFSKISFNAANKFCFSFSSCSILFPLDPGGNIINKPTSYHVRLPVTIWSLKISDLGHDSAWI